MMWLHYWDIRSEKFISSFLSLLWRAVTNTELIPVQGLHMLQCRCTLYQQDSIVCHVFKKPLNDRYKSMHDLPPLWLRSSMVRQLLQDKGKRVSLVGDK